MTAWARRRWVGFEDWLFAPGSAGLLWFVRSGLAVLFAVRLLIGGYPDLAEQSPALFDPPMLWRWLSTPPSATVVLAVMALGVAAALATLTTRRAQWAFRALWLAFVFLEGLAASRGKIIHNEVLPILVAVPILLAPDRAVRRRGPDDPISGWPYRGAFTVLALGYFFTGAAKLVASGPAWVFSENLRWVLARARFVDAVRWPDLTLAVADLPFVPQVVAALTLVIEIGMILAPSRPGLRVPLLIGVVGLHTGIYVLLGLEYFSWAYTAALFLIPWSRTGWFGGDPRRGVGPGSTSSGVAGQADSEVQTTG